MTEFSNRNEPVASVVKATERIAPVTRIAPPGQAASTTDASKGFARSGAEGAAPSGEDQARRFADYAKLRTQIATILSDLEHRSGRGDSHVQGAAEMALASLLPRPAVVLPMPPADPGMVDFVAQVSQSIARQAAQTRAALGSVPAATVDAATA